ncbi:MAG: EamA family transporter [Candidatus Peregrinibacteria bacterium]
MHWIVYALLSAFFASLTAILAKIGIKDVNSNLATAIRTIVILLFAWGIVLYQGTFRQLPTLSRFSVFFLVLSGLATGASWLFYFKALQMGNASQVAPIDKLSIVITILLSVIILHEHISLLILLGVLLMVAGSILVALG